MKKITLILSFLFFTLSAIGQIGIRASQIYSTAPEWEIFENFPNKIDDLAITKGYSFGLDVWFRLKNVRVEFYPEINYSQFNKNWNDFSDFRISTASFYFNTQIYFLDFTGDCDCPTFSKQGTFVDKGLFLLISPGFSYQEFRINTIEQFKEKKYGNSFNLGAGLGLDLGISDILTITPYVGARYFLKGSWNDIKLEFFHLGDTDLQGFNFNDEGFFQFFAGIRLGFRFDDQ